MGAELRERVERLPGMGRLLPALEGLPPAYLVGGAVRDLLLGGAAGVDLDVAVEGDARAVARALAERLGGRAVEHERFGTATVEAGDLRVDLATARRERYPRPGALPEIEPAPLADDLARRDFTINALAVGLTGADVGRLHDPHGGRADLDARLVRVLHERSFLDDPTRLLRAVRYAARLGFRVEPGTERLARAAVAGGALATVSGKRIAAELLPLLGEAEAAAAVELLRELGIGGALHPALRADADLVAGAALAAGETGADRVLAALAALIAGSARTDAPAGAAAPAGADAATDALVAWLDALQLPRAAADAVARAARRAPALAAALRRDLRPSELHALLHAEPPEALALALALGAPGEPVLRYLADLRHVRLAITGDDLRAAGVPESPALGRALAATLRRRLDGEVEGREAELRMAVELAGEDEGG